MRIVTTDGKGRHNKIKANTATTTRIRREGGDGATTNAGQKTAKKGRFGKKKKKLIGQPQVAISKMGGKDNQWEKVSRKSYPGKAGTTAQGRPAHL